MFNFGGASLLTPSYQNSKSPKQMKRGPLTPHKLESPSGQLRRASLLLFSLLSLPLFLSLSLSFSVFECRRLVWWRMQFIFLYYDQNRNGRLEVEEALPRFLGSISWGSCP